MKISSLRPRLRRLALYLAGLFVLFVLAGYFIVPPVAKSLIVKKASEALGREVSIERISVNPFALSATVSGFRLYEAGSKEVFASLDELYVNVESSSLWNLAPVVGALRLGAPRLKIVRLPGGRFNFTDILETLAKRPRSEGKAYFSLNNIELSGGEVDIDDRVEDARHAVTAIRLGIPFLSNLPTRVAVKVTPSFSASVDGTDVELKGETAPFLDTLESSLQLSLDRLPIGRYLRYVPATLAFDIPSGTLDTDLRLYFIRATGQPQRLTVSGTARLRDLAVADSAKVPLLSLPLLDVDIESIDVFARDIDLSKITVTGLSVEAVRGRDGLLNLLALAPRPEKANAAGPKPQDLQATPAQPLRYSVNRFELNDARVAFTDRSLQSPFRTELADIDLSLVGLSSTQADPARLAASIRTGFGETLALEAAVAVAPAGTEGTLELTGVRPRNYAPYYAPLVRFDIDEAKVDLRTRFRAAAEGNRIDAAVEALSLSIADLRARRSGEKEPLVSARLLAVAGVDVDLARRSATVGEFNLRDASVRIDRDKDGRINLASLLAEPAAPAPAPAPTAAVAPTGLPAAADTRTAPPWTWVLRRAVAERVNLRFDDRMPPEPVAIVLSDLAMTVDDLGSAKGARAKATLRTTINRGGSLSARGQFALDPRAGSFDLDARSIGILPLQPYFTERLNIVITGGDLSAKGSLNADLSVDPPRAGFTGEANIANFAALERLTNEELLRWKSLYFGAINVTAGPTQVAIGEIALSDFFARIILSEKGRLNLRDIVRTDPAATPAPAASATPTAPASAPTGATGAAAQAALPVKIGRISVASGHINFSDLFVRPNFRLNLTGMTGAVSALTSDPRTAADLELRGQLDGSAPVEIIGRINPLASPLFVDIKGAVRGAELSTLSAYSTTYTGYGIERGRLTLNLAYKVEGRKIDAQHRIFLDQLTFGTERIEGPSVVKLPILFAVRLLQNRRGEIDLNLPITGTLDDPQFRIGPIIWQILGNLITRAVTAPFSLLASLGGGSTEELSVVEFEPGSVVLSEAARKRLSTLGKALADRPSLRLELTGRVDAERDREGYRRAQLAAAVQAQRVRDLVRKGESTVGIGTVPMEPKEYENYLRAAYREARFPKPRNAIGMLRDLPVPEMETLMLTNTQVTPDDLRELATARAQAVENYLVKEAALSPERVFLVQGRTPSADAAGAKAQPPGARVDLAIR
ncbi:MAG: DUF748 domain-containing protein [bacterium]